jgi:dihydroorotase
MPTVLLKNANIFGNISNILILNDKIVAISNEINDADSIYDLQRSYVLPGIVDTHVHFRDLKQAEKEDWSSATQAAIYSGVTTVFDMPNNTPACINIPAFEQKLEKTKDTKLDAKFYAGVVKKNLDQLIELLEKYRKYFIGIKLYLAASSNNELFDEEHEFTELFNIAEKYDLPICIHAEQQDIIDKWEEKVEEKTIYTHNKIRNREAAEAATKFILRLASTTDAKIIIAHTSTKEEIELIRKYKKMRDNVYCEIAPHHLLLNQSHLAKAGNYAKINPPIREEEDNEALWEGIYDGTVDIIGTDHAPHKKSEKDQEYVKAPSGFPGIETLLPLMLNEVNKSRLNLKKLSELMSSNACKLFKLNYMGEVAINKTANLTVVNMKEEFTIDSSKFKSKAKYSPYDGFKIFGKATHTVVNGEVFEID